MRHFSLVSSLVLVAAVISKVFHSLARFVISAEVTCS